MSANTTHIEALKSASQPLTQRDWLLARLEFATRDRETALSDFVSEISVARVAADLIWNEIKQFNPKYLICVGLKSMPLLHAVASAALRSGWHLRVLMVREERKNHNRKKWIEGEPPSYLSDAILISDFYTSDETIALCHKAIFAEGYQLKVVAASCIVGINTVEKRRAICMPMSAIFSKCEISLSINSPVVRYLIRERQVSASRRDSVHMSRIRDQLKMKSGYLSANKELDCVKGISGENFHELASQGLPFLMDGIVEKWPIANLTYQTLDEKYGHNSVKIREKNYVERAFTKQRMQLDMTVSEYLELIAHADDDLPPYLASHIEQLDRLCHWSEFFSSFRKSKVWLGPKGTITPLHCDLDDNLFAQIWGRKKFILYSPADRDCFDIWRVNHAVDGFRYDPEQPNFEIYPKAQTATPYEVTVNPGQILYLPAGWMHHVRSLDFSLSVNCWSDEKPAVLKDIQ